MFFFPHTFEDFSERIPKVYCLQIQKYFLFIFGFSWKPLFGCSYWEVHNSTICKVLQSSGGMAGKTRLLGADSDGWRVSGAIGLVLSIRCISLLSCCPLRSISRRSITQWHIGGEEGGTRHWSALIKVCVLERWIKSNQHKMVQPLSCKHGSICACRCMTGCVFIVCYIKRKCPPRLIRLPLKMFWADLIRLGSKS